METVISPETDWLRTAREHLSLNQCLTVHADIFSSQQNLLFIFCAPVRFQLPAESSIYVRCLCRIIYVSIYATLEDLYKPKAYSPAYKAIDRDS